VSQSAMVELSPKDIRLEIKRLKARIREVEETRVAPHDDRWHALLKTDREAAQAYEEASGRAAACYEVYALWGQIDHLNDALKGRRPRGVTLN
jgi:hypothetical protein